MLQESVQFGMVIGLSLEKCIKDLVEGRVQQDRVAYIISSTNPLVNTRDIDEGMRSIARKYRARGLWEDETDGGHIHLNRYYIKYLELWESGLILCPRLQRQLAGTYEWCHLLTIGRGHWLECKQVDKPQWSPENEWWTRPNFQ